MNNKKSPMSEKVKFMYRFRRLRRFLLSAFTLSLTLVVTSCVDNTVPVLKLGTNVWLGYEPLYLARSKGFLDNEQVHLVEMSSASQVIQAFSNEVIDAAALTLDEALILLDKNEPLSIVLVMDFSNGADAIISQPHIKSLSDLRGTKIGLESGALGAYVLSRALEIGQVDLSNVELIDLEINHQENAFERGDVDAVVTFDPVLSRLVQKGAQVIFDSSQIPNEIVDILVIRNSYLKEHRDTVQHIIDAWYGALSFIEKNPASATQMMSKRQGLTSVEVQNALNTLIFPSREKNRQLLQHGPVPELLTTTQKLANVKNENKLLSSDVDSSLLFNDNKLNYVDTNND